MIFWILLAALTFLCGHWTGQIAEGRGRSRLPWFVIGILTAPLGLPLAWLLRRPRTDAAIQP